MKAVQALAVQRCAQAHPHIRCRHEGHARIPPAIGEIEERGAYRRQERRGRCGGFAIGEARGDVEARTRIQRQVRRQHGTGAEGRQQRRAIGGIGQACAAVIQRRFHGGLQRIAGDAGGGQLIGGDGVGGGEGLQAGRRRIGVRRPGHDHRRSDSKPRGNHRSVHKPFHCQPLGRGPSVSGKKIPDPRFLSKENYRFSAAFGPHTHPALITGLPGR